MAEQIIEQNGNAVQQTLTSTTPAVLVHPRQQAEPVAIDYDKIAKIVEGKQTVTEDSVLKGYFKQQGLTGDEMAQAIKAFKEEKASKVPDVDALNAQIAEANDRALKAEIKMQAMTMAGELGVSATKMPYLLKMADLSQVDAEGKVDEDKLKEALSDVLKDLPELKATAEQAHGFKVGSDGQTQPKDNTDELARIFGVKKG